MNITKEYLQAQLNQAEQGKAQMLAQLNAYEGQIFLIKQQLARLDEPEPKEEDKKFE